MAASSNRIVLRPLAAFALIAAGAAEPAASSITGTATFEAQVLAALNEARLDPRAYSDALRRYRTHFRGKIVTMPGTNVAYRTVEGAAPVAEAESFLSDEDSQAELQPASLLAEAAADHVGEERRSGRTGHFDADGASPSVRVARRGGGRQVAEVIAYGAFDASDVVRQLIVDDGVPDRGHRSILFSRSLRYAGVACGPHPKYRTMCVIDLAETADGRSAGARYRPRFASMAG